MPSPPKPPALRVASLLDRLPTARRTALMVRDHVRDDVDLDRLGKLAEQIESIDPERRLAEIARRAPGDPALLDTEMTCRGLLGAQRFLRGDVDDAFAIWAAAIAEHPDAAAEVHIMRSQILSMRREYQAALADIDRAVALRPTNAGGYARRGDCLRRLHRYPEAIANYRRAAQLDRDDLSAALGLGACLFITSQLVEAASWFTQALRIAPKQAGARVGRALCHEDLGRREEALADLDAAILLETNDAEAYRARARCRPEDQHAEIFSDLSRAIELDPSNALAWAARARKQLTRGALEQAVADATQAIALDPAAATVHFVRGIARQNGGDLAGARDDYRAAAKLDPMETTFRTALALVHQALDDEEGVRADLRALIAIAPTNPEVRAMEARWLAEDGEHARALDQFDAALALGGGASDEESAALHHERADCLRELDRTAEAAEAEERAVELDPKKALYWGWLGNYRSRLEEQKHLAEAACTRAVEVEPESAWGWFNRGLHYAHEERWAEAIDDFDRAIALQPELGVLYLQRGMARWRGSDEAADARAAVLDYTRAIELGADEGDALRWRAEALAFLDDHHAALADAERVLALDPSCGESMHMRARCKEALGDAAGAREDLERAAAMGWEHAAEELRQAGG